MTMSWLSLDIALNLLWASIGLFAFAALNVLERRYYRGSAAAARMQRLCAVLISTVCLFPAVSFTDDLYCLARLQSHVSSRGNLGAPGEEPKEGDSLQLVRLIETLENGQIEGVVSVMVTLSWTGTVSPSATPSRERDVLARSGRAPPSC
jgi:hypothetical protein